MTSRDFCYWLQGFFEIAEMGNQTKLSTSALNYAQVDIVRRHLALVFQHEINPSMGDAKHQAKLNETHSPPVATDDEMQKKVSDLTSEVERLKKRPSGGASSSSGPNYPYRC